MKLVIVSKVEIPLTVQESTRYVDMTGVAIAHRLRQVEETTIRRLKGMPVEMPGTHIQATAVLLDDDSPEGLADAYALRGLDMPGLAKGRDYAAYMLLQAGEVIQEPNRDKLHLPDLPPTHHGHFLCNGQYLLPDGKITGDPMPGFMDYRPLDSVERAEPQPPVLSWEMREAWEGDLTAYNLSTYNLHPPYNPHKSETLDCGCTAGNHRPTCRWYSPVDRSPEYPPGYCIHGVHPGIPCTNCDKYS